MDVGLFVYTKIGLVENLHPLIKVHYDTIIKIIFILCIINSIFVSAFVI